MHIQKKKGKCWRKRVRVQNFVFLCFLYGGFHKWRFPKIDGLQWKFHLHMDDYRGTPISVNLHITGCSCIQIWSETGRGVLTSRFLHPKWCHHMEVSWNRGTPKSSILMGFYLKSNQFGDPNLWKLYETPICVFWNRIAHIPKKMPDGPESTQILKCQNKEHTNYDLRSNMVKTT